MSTRRLWTVVADAATASGMTQTAPKPSVFIDTYGCQMNVLDSELVQGQLTALGYNFVESAQDAGIVLTA